MAASSEKKLEVKRRCSAVGKLVAEKALKAWDRSSD
jgi:hypothetical protein